VLIPVKLPDTLDLVRPCSLRVEGVGDIDFSRVSATQMFQIPNLAIMTIASTRMYRSLINLGNTEV
jgi:hypothetical protein